ncbi:MAG TPA: hypothetical protein VII61_15025 [Ktedonobacteraceae bacterium]
MQQLEYRPQPDQQANRGGAPRSQVILIVALLLFSVAGLASGFSVGALTRTQQAKQNNAQTMPAIQPQAKQTAIPQATKTVDLMAVGIGCPKPITPIPSAIQKADNTTTYTLEAQIVDKSIEKQSACGQGKALKVSGITCKIWITKDQDSLRNLKQTSNKLLTDIKKLQGAFPHEKTNTLLFNGNSQVQNCNPNGTTNWKYSIASNTDPGTYFIAVLADWKGILQNWAWIQITVMKAN